MQNPVRLEIARCVVPADEDAVAGAVQSLSDAQTSGNLVDIEHAEAQHRAALGKASGLTARVNGAEFPIFGYEVAPTEDGRVLATLVVEVASLSIGEPPRGITAPVVRPAAPEKPTKSTWGRPGPDPREGIPGWVPEPSLAEQVAQVAQNAAPVQVHLNPAVTPDPTSAAMRREIRRGFHGNAGGALA